MTSSVYNPSIYASFTFLFYAIHRFIFFNSNEKKYISNT